MVERGLGVSLLPAWAVRDEVGSGWLSKLRIEGHRLRRTVAVISLARFQPAATRAFLEFVLGPAGRAAADGRGPPARGRAAARRAARREDRAPARRARAREGPGAPKVTTVERAGPRDSEKPDRRCLAAWISASRLGEPIGPAGAPREYDPIETEPLWLVASPRQPATSGCFVQLSSSWPPARSLPMKLSGLAGPRFVKVTGAPYRMPAHPWARAGPGQPFQHHQGFVLQPAPASHDRGAMGVAPPATIPART